MTDDTKPVGAECADNTKPVGAEGAQIKQQITEAKQEDGSKTEAFDPGASMLGTDNEAGSAPDHDGMAEARNAPPPK